MGSRLNLGFVAVLILGFAAALRFAADLCGGSNLSGRPNLDREFQYRTDKVS